MSDESAPQDATEPEAPEQPEKPANDGPVQLPDDHPLVRALSEWKTKAKDLRDKVKEFEDRDKTDAERASEKLSALEKRANDAEGKILRLEVAIERAPEGMSVQQIRKLATRLQGDTREDLEADADDLFAQFAPAHEGGKPTARRPQERLKPGGAPETDPEPDPKKLADSILSNGL